MAAAFVESGARVFVLDIDEPTARRAASDLEAEGAVGADVTDLGQVIAAVVEASGVLGRIDGRVNAAGRPTQSALVEMSLSQRPETLNDVDLTSVFLMCRHVVPGMVERGGGRVAW